jgi:hypothetical protein
MRPQVLAQLVMRLHRVAARMVFVNQRGVSRDLLQLITMNAGVSAAVGVGVVFAVVRREGLGRSGAWGAVIGALLFGFVVASVMWTAGRRTAQLLSAYFPAPASVRWRTVIPWMYAAMFVSATTVAVAGVALVRLFNRLVR